MRLVITATKLDGRHTGRLVARANSQEQAEKNIARMLRVGDYLRSDETFLIMDAAEFAALDRSQFVDHELTTPEVMKGAILGFDSVMNSDF